MLCYTKPLSYLRVPLPLSFTSATPPPCPASKSPARPPPLYACSDRGTCGLMNTRGCFRDWPSGTDADVGGQRDPTGAIALYHNVELGWYLHYLIKHHLGGCRVGWAALTGN